MKMLQSRFIRASASPSSSSPSSLSLCSSLSSSKLTPSSSSTSLRWILHRSGTSSSQRSSSRTNKIVSLQVQVGSSPSLTLPSSPSFYNNGGVINPSLVVSLFPSSNSINYSFSTAATHDDSGGGGAAAAAAAAVGDGSDHIEHGRNMTVTYPTSSTNFTTMNNSNKQNQNQNNHRKDEIMHYIQKALAYEMEQILDLDDDNHHVSDITEGVDITDGTAAGNYGNGNINKKRHTRKLRSRMKHKMYQQKMVQQRQRQRQKRKQRQEQESANKMVFTSDNDGNSENNNDIDNDKDSMVLQSVSSAIESPPSSPASLLSLLQEVDDGGTQSNNESNVQGLDLDLSHGTSESTSNIKTAKKKTLIDLLDDEDYGFDEDEDEVEGEDHVNEYDDDFNKDIRTASDTTSTRTSKEENTLLSLLLDGDNDNGGTGTDDDSFQFLQNEKQQNASIISSSTSSNAPPTSHIIGAATPLSTRKSDDDSSSIEKGQSSLLDLLNDYGDEDFDASISNLQIENSDSNFGDDVKEENGSRKNFSTLLDLLNDDADTDGDNQVNKNKIYGSKGENEGELDGANLSFQVKRARNEPSLMDLLDDENQINSQLDGEFSDQQLQEGNKYDNKNNSLLDMLGDHGGFSNLQQQEGDENKFDNKNSSLIDMLDDYDNDSDRNVPTANENDDEIFVYDVDELLFRIKSLSAVMYREDWELFRQFQHQEHNIKDIGENDGYSSATVESFVGDQNQTLFSSSDAMEETHVDDEILLQTSQEGNEKTLAQQSPTSKMLIDELLLGTRLNKWQLKTEEFNLLLFFVATTNIHDKAEHLLNTYLYMKELGSSGIKTSAPNSDTYIILMTLLERSENTTAVAAELASRMLKYYEDKKQRSGDYDDDNALTQDFELKEESLNTAMGIFAKRLDIGKAESLMEWAMNDEVPIRLSTYQSMLRLFKAENYQEKALNLLETFIKVRLFYQQENDSFLLSS